MKLIEAMAHFLGPYQKPMKPSKRNREPREQYLGKVKPERMSRRARRRARGKAKS